MSREQELELTQNLGAANPLPCQGFHSTSQLSKDHLGNHSPSLQKEKFNPDFLAFKNFFFLTSSGPTQASCTQDKSRTLLKDQCLVSKF